MRSILKLTLLASLLTLPSCMSLPNKAPAQSTLPLTQPLPSNSPTPSTEKYVPCSALAGRHLSVQDTTLTVAADAPIFHAINLICGPMK